jgi:hypothetical protein
MVTSSGVCDFCGRSAVRWRYRCHDYVDTSSHIDATGDPLLVTVHSAGDWLACMPCHDLIEANEFRQLIERALNQYFARVPTTRQQRRVTSRLARQRLQLDYQRFQDSRYGLTVEPTNP